MCLKSFATLLSVIILTTLAAAGTYQPPYQVSLTFSSEYSDQIEYDCNGVIIQNRLILTPAICVFRTDLENGLLQKVHPLDIRIIAGNDNEYIAAPIYDIFDIYVNEKYNASMIDSNVAIIKLYKPLPLGLRDDIKWIILDDNDIKQTCMEHMYFSWTTESKLIDQFLYIDKSRNCSTKQNENIGCLHIIDSKGVEDNKKFVVPALDTEAGTGLVCKNRLVGIVLKFLGRSPLKDSKQLLYTNFKNHLDWIYEIIAIEEYRNSKQINHTISKPYQWKPDLKLQQTQAVQVSHSHYMINGKKHQTAFMGHYMLIIFGLLQIIQMFRVKYIYFYI